MWIPQSQCPPRSLVDLLSPPWTSSRTTLVQCPSSFPPQNTRTQCHSTQFNGRISELIQLRLVYLCPRGRDAHLLRASLSKLLKQNTYVCHVPLFWHRNAFPFQEDLQLLSCQPCNIALKIIFKAIEDLEWGLAPCMVFNPTLRLILPLFGLLDPPVDLYHIKH